MQTGAARARSEVSGIAALLTCLCVLVCLGLLLQGLLVLWSSNAQGSMCGFDVEAGPTGTARVVDVHRGSPADRAGLRPGDVLVSIGGIPVPPGPGRVLADACYDGPGSRVPVQVQRGPNGLPVDLVMTTGSPLTGQGRVPLLVVTSIVAVLCIGSASVAALARPGDPAARLFLLAGATFGGSLLLHNSWPSNPNQALDLQRAAAVLELLASAAVLHLFLVFPTPKPVLRRLKALGPPPLRRFGGAVGVIYLPVGVMLIALARGTAPNSVAFLLLALLLLGLALAALLHSYRHPTSSLARAQLKWIVMALALGIVVLLPMALTALTGGAIPPLPDWLMTAGWAFFPVAVGVAVMRYRLFDVDRILRASLAWPLVLAILAAFYVGMQYGIGRAAVGIFGVAPEAMPLASFAATLVLALVTSPLYRQTSALLDRFVYRHRHLLRTYVAEVGEELGRARSPEVIRELLTERAATQLGLTGAWLVLPGSLRAARNGELPGDPDPLLRRLRDSTRAAVIAPERVRQHGLAVLPAGDPVLAPWYAAGARIIIPMRIADLAHDGVGAPDQPTDGTGDAAITSHLLGVWVLGRRQCGDLLGREEIAVLARVARQAAVLLDYARLSEGRVQQELLRYDLERAREIQARLLPDAARVRACVDLAVRFQPAQDVSGDFYDLVELNTRDTADARDLDGVGAGVRPSALQIAVGDVVGKGLGAALVMALTRTTLRAIARHALAERPAPAAVYGFDSGAGVGLATAERASVLSPAATLRVAGGLLHRDVGAGVGGREYVSCVLAILEAADSPGGTPRLRVANAGQVSPLLYRAGDVRELDPPGERFPLGVLAEADYGELVVDLAPGDVLVFASDGLPEAPREGSAGNGHDSREFFGFDRLSRAVAYWAGRAPSAKAIADGIWSEVAAWRGPSSAHDDSTLLVLRVPTHACDAWFEVTAS